MPVPRPPRLAAVALAIAWFGASLAALWYHESGAAYRLAPGQRNGLPPGSRAPALTLSPPGAPPLRLGDGQPVLVHVYAPDCSLARLNAPFVHALALRPELAHIRFLALYEGPLGPEAERAAAALGLPLVADEHGPLAKALGLRASPSACLIDGSGRVRFSGSYMVGAACSSQRLDPVAQALSAFAAARPLPAAPEVALGCPLP